MKGYQYIAFALGLFALVGLAGCEADDVPGGSPEGTGRKVPVTIRLAMEDVGDVATKSGTAEVVNEDWKINTLKVQISAEGEETINLTQDNFSFSGEGETYQGISIEEKKVSLTIGKTYTVKAIANANDLEYTATSINAIRLITAENGVPMSAQDTWIIDANTETKEIKMVRMVAKMNVKITVERTVPDMLVVPKSAVLIRDNKEVLFRYSAGKSVWTYVDILMSNTESHAVTANVDRGAELFPGDTVIISGNLNIADGSSVVIKE